VEQAEDSDATETNMKRKIKKLTNLKMTSPLISSWRRTMMV